MVGSQLLVHTTLLVGHAYRLGRPTGAIRPLLTLGVALGVALVVTLVVTLVRVVYLVAAIS